MMLRRYHKQEQKESQPVTKKPVEPPVPAVEKPKRRGRRKKDDVE
jgi:hypothetical protein